MQTFLPFQDFTKSALCLDKRRCLKQVVEAQQILNTLSGYSNAWKNHPAVRMWRSYEEALKHYYTVFYNICSEVHKIQFKKLKLEQTAPNKTFDLPLWLSCPEVYSPDDLHYTHRCNLLRKAVINDDKKLMEALNSQSVHLDDHDITTPYYWPV